MFPSVEKRIRANPLACHLVDICHWRGNIDASQCRHFLSYARPPCPALSSTIERVAKVRCFLFPRHPVRGSRKTRRLLSGNGGSQAYPLANSFDKKVLATDLTPLLHSLSARICALRDVQPPTNKIILITIFKFFCNTIFRFFVSTLFREFMTKRWSFLYKCSCI